MQLSPVPTQTVLGSDGATAISPIDCGIVWGLGEILIAAVAGAWMYHEE